MEILTLSILFETILLSDEVLNGRLQLSRRLLEQIDAVTAALGDRIPDNCNQIASPDGNSQNNPNKPVKRKKNA